MLKLDDTYLELDLTEQQSALYHYVWLRDNCQCSECVHPDTGERILVTADIVDGIAPVSAQLNDGQDGLSIEWNQASHKSEYAISWLQDHNYSNKPFNIDPAYSEPILWGNDLESKIPTFDYQALYDDSQTLLDLSLIHI